MLSPKRFISKTEQSWIRISDTYEIPRFSWVPKIETGLVESKAASQGGGEPAIIVLGAVIANAIYDATGVRVLQLPMTPERIKEALRKA